MESLQNNSLGEKAAECFLTLEVGASDLRTRLRWRIWLAESPAHRRAFEACREAWKASEGLALEHPTDIELSQDRYEGEVSVALSQTHKFGWDQWSRDAAHPRRPRISRTLWGTLAAASLLVATVAGTQRRPASERPPEPIVYETGRGEQRQLTLPDGSTIMMGPEAHIEVQLLLTQRIFRLTTGEAIFTAAHDPLRPFRVYAGLGWIEDIGTAFDVRSDPDQVTVTVIQGEVEVGTPGPDSKPGQDQPRMAAATIRLSHDQQLSFGMIRGPVHAVDARRTTAWRDGQLAYIDQPLENVVADLRRYSMKDIVMEDPAVGALHYTGTVSIGELDHWATGLARVYPVQVQMLGDRLTIAAKRKDR